MSVAVDFLGLVYFHTPPAAPRTRRVLMPNGHTPDIPGVPEHVVSLFVHTGDASSTSWPPETDPRLSRLRVEQYLIPQGTIVAIPHGTGGVDTSAHDGLLPRLTGAGDPPFFLDESNADTAARMTISAGTLQAFRFRRAVVSRWQTGTSGPLTITAAGRSLSVRDGAEIVFANTSDLLTSAGSDVSHFRLYARLAREPKPNILREPRLPPGLPTFPLSHRFMAHVNTIPERPPLREIRQLFRWFMKLEPAMPLPGCSNTCC